MYVQTFLNVFETFSVLSQNILIHQNYALCTFNFFAYSMYLPTELNVQQRQNKTLDNETNDGRTSMVLLNNNNKANATIEQAQKPFHRN